MNQWDSSQGIYRHGERVSLSCAFLGVESGTIHKKLTKISVCVN